MTRLLSDIRDYCLAQAELFTWDTLSSQELVGKAWDALLNPDIRQIVECYAAYHEAINVVGRNWLHLNSRTMIFEGAQGVLLDETYGFKPYVTWTNTTDENARTLVSEIADEVDLTVLGITRSYMTRHGPGPFPTENPGMTVTLPEPHNGTGVWQGAWRAGHLDLTALLYSKQFLSLDGLVVTHMDKVPDQGWMVGVGYNAHGQDAPCPRCPDIIKGSGDMHRWMVTAPSDVQNPAYRASVRALVGSDENYPILWPAQRGLYADTVAKTLGVPLAMECYGPTAHETKVHLPELIKTKSKVLV